MKTQNTHTTQAIRPTTKLGEALEHLRDHRVRADEESRLIFCPSLADRKNPVVTIPVR